REYDARWLYPAEINLMGLNAIGLSLATLAGKRGRPKRFVVGHDYRSYSAAVKQALITGLLAAGAEVHDIGLAMSPMAYFAQFARGGGGGGMGDRQSQRQRLDWDQDGLRAATDVRPRGHDGAQGNGAGRRRRAGGRWPLHLRARRRRALLSGLDR